MMNKIKRTVIVLTCIILTLIISSGAYVTASIKAATTNASDNLEAPAEKTSDAYFKAEAQKLLHLPGQYEGVLPAADCPGIRYALFLRPDNIYQLEMTYLEAEEGKDKTFASLGRWELVPSKKMIILHESPKDKMYFAIDSNDKITLVDREGKRAESDLNFSLSHTKEPYVLKTPLQMEGTFSYMADAALFTHTFTGATFPVAMEKDYVTLEEQYLSLEPQAGEPLPVVIEGHIEKRAAMEGDSTEDALIVDRFVGMGSDETEEAEESEKQEETTSGKDASVQEKVTLEDKDWMLVRLGDKQIERAENNDGISLHFNSAEKRVHGYGGCNNYFGAYRLDESGSRLLFEQLASTKKYCPDTIDLEEQYFKMLSHVTAFEIVGNTLYLYDYKEEIIAIFERKAQQ